MKKIIISEFITQSALDTLQLNFEVDYLPELFNHQQKLIAALKGADCLIVRNRTQVNKELLQSSPQLKVVGRLGVGLDNIDTQTCKKNNIAVIPALGANDQSVAEYVLTSAFILLRNAYLYSQSVIDGNWPREKLIGNELQGKVLGLVGFGSIAQKTAKKAIALGMKTQGYDPYIQSDSKQWKKTKAIDSLNELLQSSDIISLHIPLTDSTKNLIDAKAIGAMKQGAILINSARGGIVDEEALIAALKNGKLKGASLDVFNQEPINATSGKKFNQIPNLILTPHIAGLTEESNDRVSEMIAQKVTAALKQI